MSQVVPVVIWGWVAFSLWRQKWDHLWLASGAAADVWGVKWCMTWITSKSQVQGQPQRWRYPVHT